MNALECALLNLSSAQRMGLAFAAVERRDQADDDAMAELWNALAMTAADIERHIETTLRSIAADLPPMPSWPDDWPDDNEAVVE